MMNSVDELGCETEVFRKPAGQHYLDFLEDMHHALKPKWYLEVGTQTGASLARATCRSVSVDPKFVIRQDIWAQKPELHLFQTTSDDFFASGALKRLGAKFDLAFLDGMHLFEFLLRDFINAEKQMTKAGHIVLHDCLPWSENMALRHRGKVTERAWTGDVWKVVPVLKKFRPDLTIRVFDAAPTGLVVISNLNPRDKTLSDQYDAIIQKHGDDAGLRPYLAATKVIPTDQSPWNGLRASLSGTLHFAIKTNVPRPRVQERWGDYHFAVGLAKAFERLGHTASVRTRKHWGVVEERDEIDLVIKGHTEHPRRKGHLHLEWLISSAAHGDADHSFFASAPLLSKARADEDMLHRTSLLPQAFDSDRIALPKEDVARKGVLFAGIARKGKRPIVNYALANDVPLELWGPGWEETEAARFHRGSYLSNEEIGAHYAQAEVVLNDHTRVMRFQGFPSNRIFDALACATPVISDAVAWLPEDMDPFVARVSSPAEFAEALARIRAETKAQRQARYAFAKKMRQLHSFDARAQQIINTLKERWG